MMQGDKGSFAIIMMLYVCFVLIISYNMFHLFRHFFQQELASMVDQILDEDDLNKDGYIDYPEFIASQQREEAVAK